MYYMGLAMLHMSRTILCICEMTHLKGIQQQGSFLWTRIITIRLVQEEESSGCSEKNTSYGKGGNSEPPYCDEDVDLLDEITKSSIIWTSIALVCSKVL